MATELSHTNPEKPGEAMVGDKHSSSGDITAEGGSATSASNAKAAHGELYDFGDEAHLKKVQKSLLWKMDLQVVTMALAIYFLSFLDR
jgi:hypothetical protein